MTLHNGVPTREARASTPDSATLHCPPGQRKNGVAHFALPFSNQTPILAADPSPFATTAFQALPDSFGDPLTALLQDNRRLCAEIAEARRLADRALRARDNLVATLAHELRGPLGPISSSLKVMEMQDAVASQRERRVIERQVAHLTRLVDDLLDVAHAVRGKVELKRERIALSAVLACSVELASAAIEARRHTLVTHLPVEELYVDADQTRLAQVFANLLTNAARYTPEGGEIVLWASAEGAQCCIAVKDNGQGIAPHVLPRIFDLFYQGSHDTEKSDGGLGIGLALVKNFVGLHGGSVTVRSEGLGCGSEFIVRLPMLESDGWTGSGTSVQDGLFA